jgi:serine protease Do
MQQIGFGRQNCDQIICGGYMFRKPFVLFVISAFAISLSAQTPEPKKDRDKAEQVFSWSFDGDGSYLGVQTAEITRENFAKFGLREVRGVAVEKVIDGSPAAAAGIQPGDVIVRFNGEDVSSSRKLTRLLGEVDPDHTAKIVVIRGGSEREIPVIIGKRPMPKFEQGNFEFNFPNDFKFEMPKIDLNLPHFKNMPELKNLPDFKNLPGMPDGDFMWQHFGGGRQIGIGVTPLTKQLADHFGVEGGALINSVRENSPAAKAGLKAGDIVIEVDGKPIKGDGDIMRAVREKKQGEVTLTVVRGGNRQTVKVTPEESKGGFQFDDDHFELLAPPPAPGNLKNQLTPMPLDQFLVRGRVI